MNRTIYCLIDVLRVEAVCSEAGCKETTVVIS